MIFKNFNLSFFKKKKSVVLDKYAKFKYINEDSYEENLNPLGNSNIDDIRYFISKIINWYEIKFPDRNLFRDCYGNVKADYNKYNNCYFMTLNELTKRLSDIILKSLKCDYYNRSFINLEEIEHLIERNNLFVLCLFKEENGFFRRNVVDKSYVVADNKGNVHKITNNKILNINNENISELKLDELKDMIKYGEQEINYYQLKDCVNGHKADIIMRKRLIEIIIREIILGATDIDYGYYRACEFYKDFNSIYNFNFGDNFVETQYNRVIAIIKEEKNLSKKNEKKLNKKKNS